MSAEMMTTADGGCPAGESGPVQDVPGGSPVEAPNHAAFSVGFPDAIPWLSLPLAEPLAPRTGAYASAIRAALGNN